MMEQEHLEAAYEEALAEVRASPPGGRTSSLTRPARDID